MEKNNTTISKQKEHLILFTTKWFEKNTNDKPSLFSSNNCVKNQIKLNNDSSVYKHTFKFLKPDIILNTIKKVINNSNFINNIIGFDSSLNTKDKNLAARTFNQEEITSYKVYYKDKYEDKFKKYSDLNFIKDNLQKKKGLEELKRAYKVGMDILYSYIKANPNLLTFDDIYQNNKNFSSRIKIWKIKNKEIYAYRCLDLQYDDEVLTVKDKEHPREGFITALFEDIAKLKNLKCSELFTNYQITFVLHRDELNFPQVTIKLSQKEIESHLIKYNKGLGSFKGVIKDVIVFQHDYGIIPEILLTSNNDISTQNIFNKIITYFEFREQFNINEKKTLKLLNKDLKKINNDEIDELMKVFKKKTSDNTKLF